MERKVAETITRSMAKYVAYRILLAASKFHLKVRQQSSKRVLPDAKAVNLSLQLLAEVVDTGQQGIESLVRRNRGCARSFDSNSLARAKH